MAEERKAIKAYNNLEFLNSPDARLIRILAEYLEPARRFRQYRIQDTIVFFGSARIKARSIVEAEIQQIEEKIADFNPAPSELEERLEIARHELEMSQYYEDAFQIARMLT